MREKSRVLLCGSCVFAALAAYANAQVTCGPPGPGGCDPSVTVSCTAIGGNSLTGGTQISIECFITNTSNGSLGIRGGQTDMPNLAAGYPFSGGGSLFSVPGPTGGTSNPDGAGGPGPSSGGLQYIFGPTGLGPYQFATAIIAHTPGIGEPPTVMSAGETRYLGTWFYTVDDCAAGTLAIGPRCSPMDAVCDNVPAGTDTTRFRDDDAGMGLLIPATVNDKGFSVETGTCCEGTNCLCDGVGATCCTDPAATGRPAACGAANSFNGGQTCFLDPPANTIPNPTACACTTDSQCDNGQFCDGLETCDELTGDCVPGVPPVCPGTTQCTNGVCDPAANGGAGGCVVNNKPDGLACSVGGEGDPQCDNPDTCVSGTCSENLKAVGTPCGSSASGECDNADTCNGAGACSNNNKIGPCTDDGNVCTDDLCAGGVCTHPNDDSNACDDGLFCTSGDNCTAGSCGGTAVDCADDCEFCSEAALGCVSIETVPCTTPADCGAVPGASCPAGGGNCQCNPCATLPEGTDLGIPCDEDADCPPGVNCSASGSCACGDCVGLPDGADCDDGDPCTRDDVCDQERCVSYPLCPHDNDPCTTDSCDGADCIYTPIPGCDDTPVITIEPKDGTINGCVAAGDPILMSIELSSNTVCIAGGQFRLVYDPSCLDFVGLVGSGVWTNVIYQNVDEANGVIVVAVGAKLFPGAAKCDDSGNMVDITFTKIGKCNECDICMVDLNPAHNMLTDDKGLELDFPLVCSGVIRDDRPDTLQCPFQDTEGTGIAVNSDCLSTTANVTWGPVSSNDQCDGKVPLDCTCTYEPLLICRVGASNKIGDVCQGGSEGDVCSIVIGVPPFQVTYEGTCQPMWPASQVDCTDFINTGGDLPQGNYLFDCSSVKSPEHPCPDGGTCRWTVQVSDHQSINAHVQLSPVVVSGQFDRCICFELFSSCTPEVSEEVCETMHFGGPNAFFGQSDEVVKVKKGKFVCITARDRQHSLRSTDASLICDGTSYIASFGGDPFFGGNWLIQGNLNRDNVINILDFGVFLGQVNQNPNPNKNKFCDDNDGQGFTHADLNGDGNVDVADFTFIQINFLEDDKNSCCPDSAAAQPVDLLTEISVKDLREMGMGDLAVADLNNDGLVNTEDMAAYLAGARPKDAGKGERGTNGRVGSLRR